MFQEGEECTFDNPCENKELSVNKSSPLTGDVFCHPTTEHARIPGYVSIFMRKYGEKQTRNGVFYLQTAPKVWSRACLSRSRRRERAPTGLMISG
jgi:hypothetical protein